MIYLGHHHHHHNLFPSMSKTLEIHVRSAEGLKVNRKPIKTKTFIVIKIGDKSKTSNLNESVGSSDPTWNYVSDMQINCNEEHFILIEVFFSSSGRNKKIGEAKIPTNDFMGRYSLEGHLNVLSYRLRDEYGDKCGIINVSVMVKPEVVKDYGGCSSDVRIDGPVIDGYGRRMVTGVPVWFFNQRQS